ncbi:MAG TPA: glycosyltransferase, partial [Longimicrobium sp.]|nr:glycosyltransferase [Longimicrobium sp.]
MPATILALLDYYLPGSKAGGPVRSVQHLVHQLGGDYRFRIVTRDRDAGDHGPYADLHPNTWHPVEGAETLYLPPEQTGFRALRRILRGTPHDVLYLNSLFSPRLTIIPLLLRRLGRVPARPVVLAPRGELHPGALSTGSWYGLLPAGLAKRVPTPKYLKKRLYLAVARAVGLFRGVVWQASTDDERADVLRHLGARADVVVAPDLVAAPPAESGPAAPVKPKAPGELRVLFVSRIAPKKNLHVAAALLGTVQGQVDFDVYGPVDDRRYWEMCQVVLDALPPHVNARYHGALPYDRVRAVLRAHHLLFLPTRGENFGHVVLEALIEGCPVLVSDQTPWRGLEAARAGWDLPLDDPEAFTRALRRCMEMDAAEHEAWRAGAAAYGRGRAAGSGALERNRVLFRRALGVAEAPSPATPARPAARADLTP